ncbi:bifunctional DNA primase/polymerase [Ensifer sp.]|uniref:bifunctional DNA primase/polymerase n=1 Tax=Ensifer sp. TaxID=1872086 RepID=UPI002E15CD70|nr:bifunctional DNA primase/polymerase [Ensifer sp.]
MPTTTVAVQPKSDTPTIAGNLSVALEYIAAGIPIFPCRAWTETDPHTGEIYDPKSPLTSNGLYGASTNERIIREWWRRNPKALVGIPTGEKTGFFALDVDVKEGKAGDRNLAALEAEHAQLPRTVVVQTATGGFHYLFRHVDGLTTSTGSLPEHIDIRAQGGYVIAAGSEFPDGSRYDYLGGTPADLIAAIGGVAEAPAWLVDVIRTPRYRATSSPTIPMPRNDDVSAAEVEELLSYISPECGYQDWINALMAVHGELGESGLAVADSWSATGSKYKRGEVARKWKTFKAGAGIGMGTLTVLARDGGADLSAIGKKHRGRQHDDTQPIDPDKVEAFVARELAKKTPVAANDNEPTKPTADAADEPSSLPVVNPVNWHGQPVPEREWFIEGLVPHRQVTILAGDGGVGKSLLALQFGAASALGVDTAGYSPTQGRVLYLGAEDEGEEFHRRLVDIVRGHGRQLSDLGDFRLIPMADADALLAIPDKSGVMLPTAVWRQFCELAREFRPRLIVLDTVADLFGGDEIKRGQARQFIGMLRRLAIDLDCSIILLAHPSQEGIRSGSGSSGSTGWKNSSRSQLYFSRPDGDKEADPDIRLLSTKKINYGKVGNETKLRWEHGCFVAEPAGGSSQAIGLINRKAEKVFIELLRTFSRTGQNVGASAGTNYAPAKMAKHPAAEGHSKKALEGAMQRLLEDGTIKLVWDGPPSKPRQRLMVSADDYGRKEGDE